MCDLADSSRAGPAGVPSSEPVDEGGDVVPARVELGDEVAQWLALEPLGVGIDGKRVGDIRNLKTRGEAL